MDGGGRVPKSRALAHPSPHAGRPAKRAGSSSTRMGLWAAQCIAFQRQRGCAGVRRTDPTSRSEAACGRGKDGAAFCSPYQWRIPPGPNGEPCHHLAGAAFLPRPRASCARHSEFSHVKRSRMRGQLSPLRRRPRRPGPEPRQRGRESALRAAAVRPHACSLRLYRAGTSRVGPAHARSHAAVAAHFVAAHTAAAHAHRLADSRLRSAAPGRSLLAAPTRQSGPNPTRNSPVRSKSTPQQVLQWQH